MMQYRIEELRTALDSTDLTRGEQYHRLGRVRQVAWRGSRTLVAEVAGSERVPYECEILLERDQYGQLEVDGACSCPVGYNCKHVAAALLAAAGTRPRRLPGGMNAQVEAWLQTLAAAEAGRDLYPAHVKDRLLYILDLQTFPGRPPRLSVAPVKTRVLKSGGYGVTRPYTGFGDERYVLPIDEVILNQLDGVTLMEGDRYLDGRQGSALLQQIVETGRCHWQDKDSPPLQLGEERSARFQWLADELGRQWLHLEVDAPLLALPLEPPWYIDPVEYCCGPLETGVPARVAGALAQAPALDPEAADAVAKRLQELDRKLPLPRRLERKEHRGRNPTPCLLLESRPVRNAPASTFGTAPVREFARLVFDYGGLRVSGPAPHATVPDPEQEVLWELERDSRAEQRHRKRLRDFAFRAEAAAPDTYTLPDRNAWARFWLQGAPALRAEGWQVEVDSQFRLQVAEIEDWYAELDEEGRDWFGLELGVTVDGERVNLLPMLSALIRDLPPTNSLAGIPDEHLFLLPLEDGRLLPLPAARVRPVLQTLLELYDPKALDDEGRLPLSRQHSAMLADLDQAGALRWTGGERLRRLGERLQSFRGIEPVTPPEGLCATLRGYQQDGLNWLQFLREYEFGGVLADDMGLGKTLQTLAHLLKEKEAGRADRPSLVVVPTSLLGNWRREAAQFTPSLRVLTLHGPKRQASFKEIPNHDLVLTTYPLLGRDAKALTEHCYHLLVLDEAQHIKNPRALAAEAARRLEARHRLCLTGTPLENHLGELWSLFHFLMPGLLGDKHRFQQLYRTPIEKQRDDSRREQLRRRVAPFMLRRTKEAVAPELPPRTEILRTVELEGAQRDLYETVRLALHERVREEIARRGVARSQIVILDALLKLRQICCDPRLVKLEAAHRVKRSAKLDLLMELLPKLINEGRRILLFSQFTSMLALIEEALPKRLEYVKLTGETRDRDTPIARFQNGEVPLFLISLKAGGTGLNLTAADTVIHYDPWWNPAAERQATDRAHRIGQDKPVFVYKLITEGTVEEKILELQADKARLSASILEEGAKGAGKRLEAEDLQALFEPL